MRRENIGLLIAFVLAIAIPLIAIAGLNVTEKHEGWQLTAGTTVTNYTTYDACKAAAIAAGAGDYKCKDVTSLKVETTCEDVSKPEFKVVVGADGLLVLPELKVDPLPDGSWGPTQEQGFIAAPYPTCWTLAWVPYTGEWHAPDGLPTQDAGPWVYGIDYPVGTACPAQATAGCYIPPHPDVPPPKETP